MRFLLAHLENWDPATNHCDIYHTIPEIQQSNTFNMHENNLARDGLVAFEAQGPTGDKIIRMFSPFLRTDNNTSIIASMFALFNTNDLDSKGKTEDVQFIDCAYDEVSPEVHRACMERGIELDEKTTRFLCRVFIWKDEAWSSVIIGEPEVSENE